MAFRVRYTTPPNRVARCRNAKANQCCIYAHRAQYKKPAASPVKAVIHFLAQQLANNVSCCRQRRFKDGTSKTWGRWPSADNIVKSMRGHQADDDPCQTFSTPGERMQLIGPNPADTKKRPFQSRRREYGYRRCVYWLPLTFAKKKNLAAPVGVQYVGEEHGRRSVEEEDNISKVVYICCSYEEETACVALTITSSEKEYQEPLEAGETTGIHAVARAPVLPLPGTVGIDDLFFGIRVGYYQALWFPMNHVQQPQAYSDVSDAPGAQFSR